MDFSLEIQQLKPHFSWVKLMFGPTGAVLQEGAKTIYIRHNELDLSKKERTMIQLSFPW